MDVFYAPVIESGYATLDPDESNHCIRVLRHKAGDRVLLIDGMGGQYVGEIESEDKKSCRVMIISGPEELNPLPYALHIGIAPVKSADRFDWFVEKATEIGVSSITPLICARSERRNIRSDRLRKVALSATKQSMKACIPVINEPALFDHWIRGEHSAPGFIAHCAEGSKQDLRVLNLPDALTILIGPEGDFSSEEITLARENGFQAITLGTQRLRTETAGIVACSWVCCKLGY